MSGIFGIRPPASVEKRLTGSGSEGKPTAQDKYLNEGD